jgi:hypothetical protein
MLLGILLGLSLSQCKAATEEDSKLELFKYTHDASATVDFTGRFAVESESFLLQTRAYVETGSRGVWSFDPDPLRYNLKLRDDGASFFWFGREQPLNLTRNQPVEATSALGSVWGQNDLDALNPHVSGWVGLGSVVQFADHWKFNLAFSPLFLPTFGPSLGFTDRGTLNPARYARVASVPDQVDTGTVNLPIRYQLKVEQLSQLLLQPQAFGAITHDDDTFAYDAYYYTAPKTNPIPTTDGKVNVTQDNPNAHVLINAQFPREYWTGARLQLKKVIFQPAVELLQNLRNYGQRILSITGYAEAPKVNPYVVKQETKTTFGFLTHFGPTDGSPQMSDAMVFIKVPFVLTDALTFSTELEATLLYQRESAYFMNELEYMFNHNLSALGTVRLLTGKDNTYFGDWRDNNSVSTGVRWLW